MVAPLLREAMRQHKLGQLEQAEQAYRQVLSQTPDDADALHYLGVLMHRKGESRKGARLIRKAIKRVPSYIDAHRNLGNVLKESGEPAKAERCYRKAIELQPEDAATYSNLCSALRLQGRHEEAIEAVRKSIEINGENAFAWLNCANTLKDCGMIEPCIEAYRRALDLSNELVEAHIGLCYALYRMEKISDSPQHAIEERVRAYEDWLENEPDNPLAKFMLAACAGDDSVARVPDSVVKNLFDGFAATFDENLALLDYRVPALISDHLERLYGKPGADLAILDAGCGTGLCAEFLKRYAANLVGVDLSSGMLERAARLGRYDELVEAELVSFMKDEGRKYDLVVSADTLIYFGRLDNAFGAARDSLNPGGRLVFSVEKLEADTSSGFRINTSGRYSHSTEYVRANLHKAGLRLASMSDEILRYESGDQVQGLLVDAERVA